MELMAKEKTGFRKTEVGLIPEDWDLIKIGDVLEFKNGLNKAKEYFGKGTPIINYMDVFRHPGLTEELINGKVTLSNPRRTTSHCLRPQRCG
jgi:type I restriction enzyme, S subunit